MELVKIINNQGITDTDYENLKNCLLDPGIDLMAFSIKGSINNERIVLPVTLIFEKPEVIIAAFGEGYSTPPAEVQSIFRKELLALAGLQEEDLPGNYLEAINRPFPVWVTT